jgi:hypothetical protein
MKHLGWPAILAVAVVGIVLAGLGGALIANATSDDDSEPAAAALPTADATATREAPVSPSTGQAQPVVVVDDDDIPLGKTEARRVGRAAVKAAGGGTVVEIDRSDDPGETYEVEVLTARGEIDIALDQNLHRVQNLAYDD